MILENFIGARLQKTFENSSRESPRVCPIRHRISKVQSLNLSFEDVANIMWSLSQRFLNRREGWNSLLPESKATKITRYRTKPSAIL